MKRILIIILALLFLITALFAQKPAQKQIKPLNAAELPKGSGTIAIVDVNLIDGNGGKPVPDATVIVKGDRILAAGSSKNIQIPQGTEIVQGKGMSLLPGLIDSHFHIDGSEDLPSIFLQNGITSIRDPGLLLFCQCFVRFSSKFIIFFYLNNLLHLLGL